MYVLRTNAGAIVTRFDCDGIINHIHGQKPLKFHSISDLIKFLRCQPQLDPTIPQELFIHKIVEVPVALTTTEVV